MCLSPRSKGPAVQAKAQAQRLGRTPRFQERLRHRLGTASGWKLAWERTNGGKGVRKARVAQESCQCAPALQGVRSSDPSPPCRLFLILIDFLSGIRAAAGLGPGNRHRLRLANSSARGWTTSCQKREKASGLGPPCCPSQQGLRVQAAQGEQGCFVGPMTRVCTWTRGRIPGQISSGARRGQNACVHGPSLLIRKAWSSARERRRAGQALPSCLELSRGLVVCVFVCGFGSVSVSVSKCVAEYPLYE